MKIEGYIGQKRGYIRIYVIMRLHKYDFGRNDQWGTSTDK